MRKLLKKSQLWYFDLITAITFFVIVLLIVFTFITNNHLIPGSSPNEVLNDADRLSESLMTTGLPMNWTDEYVVTIGLLTDENRLNITKLSYLKNMTLDDYDNTRHLLGLRSDYLITFRDIQGSMLNLTNSTYIGKPGHNLTYVESLNPENLFTISRYMVYHHHNISEIIEMETIVWQE